MENNTDPILIFLCGPHCSGKTSILKTLIERGVISERGSEIGKDLFYERKFETKSANLDFEINLAQLELQRDYSYIKKNGIIGVETWHPGNLAYAAIRNPNGITQLIDLVKTSPFLDHAIGIWLRIPKEEIGRRTQTFKHNKDWAGEFYGKIDELIGTYLFELNLMSRTTIINANKPFNEVVDEVSNTIYQYTKSIYL